MTVNVGCVYLGRIVSHVLLPWMVVEPHVLLCLLIKEVEVAHFKTSRALSLDSVIDDSNGFCVIHIYRSWWL